MSRFESFTTQPLTWFMALLLAAFVAGCGDGNGAATTAADTTSPTVSATVPVNLATGVARNANITATFSEAMLSSTITDVTFTLKQGATDVPGVVSYVGVIATFNPASDLTASTNYAATVSTGVKDAAGNAMALTKTWSFTTGTATDTAAPTVLITVPANAGTGAVNANITATFSEPMDPLTITGTTFTLLQGSTPVSGVVSYVGNTATFNPSANLVGSSPYTATITTGVADLAGNAMLAAKSWSFTSGATPDTTAPNVSLTSPLDAASGVVINSNITAVFDEVMDSLTLTNLTFTLAEGASSVVGNVTYLGNTATFNPDADLAASAVHTATVTTGATDLAGNALATSKVWSFTTAAAAATGATPPNLGEAGRFVILASQTITTTGASVISNGDMGIMDQARSYFLTGGFTPTGPAGDFTQLTGGTSYASDDANPSPFPYPLKYATVTIGSAWATTLAMIDQSRTDLGIAYTYLAGTNPTAPTQTLASAQLGGQTLTPGVYYTSANVLITTGPLQLDAQGDANAVWIFTIDGTLTTGAPSGAVSFVSGVGQAKNVYWRTGGGTVIEAGITFLGNVFAQTQVNVLAGANVTGSLYAVTDQVTLGDATVTKAP